MRAAFLRQRAAEADRFAQEDESPDKWHPRQTPTVAVEQLMADRTNPATKGVVKEAGS